MMGFKKQFYLKYFRNALAITLIFVWIFSGWPRILPIGELGINTIRIPPEVQKARAAEVTIDNAVSTVGTSHVIFGSQTVFISDQTGYKFYRDSSNECAYSKTTDGGGTWGGAVLVDDQGSGTDCINIAVWYDRWTPGDTTGTNIHIVTMDTGSDSLFYNALDTSTDTRLTSSTAIDTDPSAVQAATNGAGANYPTITKGTDGILYVAEADAGDSFVLKCSTTCGTGTNWSEVGTSPLDLANDFNILMPLAGGNILLIDHDINADDNRSKVWNGTSWDANWTSIDTGAVENTTYDQAIAAVVDPATNDIYLAYTADDATPGTDDDIRTAIYSSGAWTAKTNVITNSSCAGVADCGLTGVSIAFDTNTGNVYVAYAGRTTPGTATTGNVYWKKSTDGMVSWGSESAAVNATADNTYGVDLNGSSNERIFVSYDQQNLDDMFGDTIADPPAPTLSVSQPDGVSDTVTVGDLYNITYTLADSDDTVTAAFYYDTNSTGLDGSAISGACATAAEGTDATCSWNTAGVTPGSYYVYGITNDGVNPQVSAYSSGQITISSASTGAFDTYASSSASFNSSLPVVFTSQTSTMSNVGAVKMVDDRGSSAGWPLNLTSRDWKTEQDVMQMDYDGSGSDGDLGKLCVFGATATLYVESGSLTGVTKGGNDCFSASLSTIDLVTASNGNGNGTYWLTDLSLAQFIPSNPTAAVYTTTIIFTLSYNNRPALYNFSIF